MKTSNLPILCRYFFIFKAAVLLCLLSNINPATASESASSSGQIVRVGVYNYKPMSFRDSDGQLKGLYIDLLEHIARLENWQIQYKEGAWDDCIQWLESEKIDLLAPFGYSEERRSRFNFNHQGIAANWGSIYLKKGLKIESLYELNEMSIAVHSQGFFAEWFREFSEGVGIRCRYIEAADYEGVFDLIEDGSAQAAIVSQIFGATNAGKYRHIKNSSIIFGPTEGRFAGPLNASRVFLDAIDRHLADMKTKDNSEYHKILERWSYDRLVAKSQNDVLPRWLKYLLFGAVTVIIFFLIISMLLERSVKLKTAELVRTNDQLNHEIKERISAEAALAENERALSTLMDNLPGAVYRCRFDEKRSIEFISQGIFMITGYPAESYGNGGLVSLRKIIHPSDLPAVDDTIQENVNKDSPFQLIYRIRLKSGQYRWVYDQGRAMYRNGRPDTIEGFITDISQQQEAELRLQRENRHLRASLKKQFHFGNIVGKSPAIREIYELILKAADSDDNVIVYGESGTGKELVSRAIHELSMRKDKPYVVVNCGAIPENLIESEFFGYVKGAFTGADTDKSGFLEKAAGGTLFLDEIGEISLNIQVKLLRAIESGGFTPIGGGSVRKPDFRIMAATNRNLSKMVAAGQIREDFFYRVHIIPIHIPPLRDRKEDIPLLVDHFLQNFEESKRQMITGNILEMFKSYHWPGNVRELRNVVNRYLTLGRLDLGGQTVLGKASQLAMDSNAQQTERIETVGDLKAALRKYERECILGALIACNWHQGSAARELNINPKTLFTKMKTYRIQKPFAR
mgnify:CR=1 FL=1